MNRNAEDAINSIKFAKIAVQSIIKESRLAGHADDFIIRGIIAEGTSLLLTACANQKNITETKDEAEQIKDFIDGLVIKLASKNKNAKNI